MSLSSSFLFLLISLFAFAQSSTVPPADQFKFVNKGKFGTYSVEYGASYRVLSIFKSPYHLCFYNTTPNAFTLALGMGHLRPNLLLRWVWEANRGLPVEENASFSFGSDGNLVLANAAGRVVWQSNTANKGAVGFKVLPNGNMVVYDSKNNYLWQSFHGPITDTLLIGQSFGHGLADKLVSRASESVNTNGPYSMRLVPTGLGFYNQTKNSPKPTLYSIYGTSTTLSASNVTKEVATFTTYPNAEGDGFFYFIAMNSSIRGSLFENGVNHDSTLSFLRLDVEGNMKAFTFYNKVSSNDWEETM